MDSPVSGSLEAAQRAAKQDAMSWLLLVAATACILAVSFAVDPHDIDSGRVVLSPTCPSVTLFDRECPACGMTRGFTAMSHGRVTEAMKYNRASPALYALTWTGLAWGLLRVAQAINVLRRTARGKKQP